MAAETERSSHKVYEKDKIGEVQIADEVVAIIAGLAATEVDGVDSMAGNITNELVGKLGMKNLSKGVKVEVTEEHVSVNMALNLKYGYSIPDVCEKVQEKVKNAIENMTGLMVLDVNIKIAGVSLEESKDCDCVRAGFPGDRESCPFGELILSRLCSYSCRYGRKVYYPGIRGDQAAFLVSGGRGLLRCED